MQTLQPYQDSCVRALHIHRNNICHVPKWLTMHLTCVPWPLCDAACVRFCGIVYQVDFNLNMLQPSRLMTFLHCPEIYDTYQIFASQPSVFFLNRSVNCRVQIGLDLAFRANFNLITIQKISLRAPWRISLTSWSQEKMSKPSRLDAALRGKWRRSKN